MLYDLLRYHFGWVDERGNPDDSVLTPLHHCGLVALAAADAVSGDYEAAIPAASAVELACGDGRSISQTSADSLAHAELTSRE